MTSPGSVSLRQIVFVTGKGGTGKSTISTAIGLAAANSGLETMLIETHGASQIAARFGRSSDHYETRFLAPRLRGLSLTPEACVKDFVIRQVRFSSIYRVVFRNRIMGPFMDAVPGLPDLIQLGKIYDVAEGLSGTEKKPDVIVIDAPATGHGLTMLQSPLAMMQMTSSGPLHANAASIHEVFSDRRRMTIILTSLPTPLAVNETIELYERLGEYQQLVSLCILNQTLPTPSASQEPMGGVERSGEPPPDPHLQEALILTERWRHLASRQTEAIARLRHDLPVPVISLPRFLRPMDMDDLSSIGDVLTARSDSAVKRLQRRAWGAEFAGATP